MLVPGRGARGPILILAPGPGLCDIRTMSAAGWREVGERVREARVVARLTQSELAYRLGLERSALAKIEGGERKLDALELFQLSDVLRLPFAHFVGASPLAAVSRRAVLDDTVDTTEEVGWLLDADLAQHARDAQWLADEGLLPNDVEWTREAKTPADARQIAIDLREYLGIAIDRPVGPLASAFEAAGLYVLAVERGGGGASLRAAGYGVAVVGAKSDPGRRRFTATHEFGHHVLGDAYSSDLTFTGRDEAERIVDAFASEFLLPSARVAAVLSGKSTEAQRGALIALSAEFRVSWSLTVRTAEATGVGIDVQHLRSAAPLAADFLLLPSGEPDADLEVGTTGSVWRQAVLTAFRRRRITAERAVGLLHDALSVAQVEETAE